MTTETFAELFEEMCERESRTVREAGMRQVGRVRDVAKHKIKGAYIYVQTGGDRMLEIEYVTMDWWVVTGQGLNRKSFSCTPDTPVYGKVWKKEA